MGNSPTCMDCDKFVPKTVRVFDILPRCNGRTVYKYFTNKEWVLIGNKEYLCPDCLTKRQVQLRQEEKNKQREQERREREAAERARQEESRRKKRKNERERQEQERARQEHLREKEEQKRREQEEQRIERERQEQERALQEHLREKEEQKRREEEEQRIERERREQERAHQEHLKEREEQRRREEEERRTQREKQERIENVDKWIENQKATHICQNRTVRSKAVPQDLKPGLVSHMPSKLKSKRDSDLQKIYSHIVGNQGTSSCNQNLLTNVHYTAFLPGLMQEYKFEEIEGSKLQNRISTVDTNNNQTNILTLATYFPFFENITTKNEYVEVSVFSSYITRQRMYCSNKPTAATLIRKICDALVVIQKDTQLLPYNHLINSFLETFFELLLDFCACEKRSCLQKLQLELGWTFDDLLVLLWYINTCDDKGSDILTEIISNELKQPDRRLSELLTVKMGEYYKERKNLASPTQSNNEEENEKQVENVLTEIQNSSDMLEQKDVDKILGIWRAVENIIIEYGYPNHLTRSWKVQNPSVNISVFDIKDMDINAEDSVSKRIAEIFLGVRLKKEFWPRSTQFVSLALLIQSMNNGKLLEINTGEGKTCIIAMFSVFLAMAGKYVDIVSSSAVLAQRDSEEWSSFYEQFGLQSESNLTLRDSETRLQCYRKHVVYGTVSSFASDILRQEFLMEDTRGQRSFDAVIVDEVDCMLLDHGVNLTYLSSAAPGMRHLEPVLLMIWLIVNQHSDIKTKDNQSFVLGKPESFYVFLGKLWPDSSDGDNTKKTLEILHMFEEREILRKGFVETLMKLTISDLTKGDSVMTELDKHTIFNCLKYVETITDISFEFFEILENTIQNVPHEKSGLSTACIPLLIVGDGLVCQLYQDESVLFDLIHEKVECHLTVKDREPEQMVHELPTYLLGFVKNRLPKWIENAFTAKRMRPGREYLVNEDEIIPVDFESTGIIELDTKWGDGLHQFLELKHGKNLSAMTLVTNFLSNNEFFHRYKQKIFGVSGTLGSTAEVSFLKRTYQLSCMKIPTHKRKRFTEIPGFVLPNKQEWTKCILDIVNNCVSSLSGERKTVLIVCEDINTAEEIHENLKVLDCTSLTLFTKNEQDKKIGEKKFSCGEIIVATNIAGRGTDIEISKEVITAGGLSVLVTFLPMNARVERQVFGRSARKGQPGTAQIILNRETLPFHLQGFSDLEELRKIRDEIEEARIKDIEDNLLRKTFQKEKLFQAYCSFIKRNTRDDTLSKKIVLNSMHEFWGLWLKMRDEQFENNFSKTEKDLTISLEDAFEKVTKTNSPTANIYHVIHFANERLAEKEVDKAIKLYTKAIENDPQWAAVAFYNRARCFVLQGQEGDFDKAIEDLKKARDSFGMYQKEVTLLLQLLHSINIGNSDQGLKTKSQFMTRCQILSFLNENIEMAGKRLTELKETRKKATAVAQSVFTVALGDEKRCKMLDNELYVFWDLGLQEIVTINERSRFCWKGLVVALFGVLQIAAGTLMVAASSGLLTKLGWAFVSEGINDVCTGSCAIYTNDQNFAKTWLLGKVVSIGISIVSFGFNQVKIACKGKKGIRAAISAIKRSAECGVEGIVKSAKGISEKVASKTFSTVMKESCKEVVVHTGKELLERGGKYLFDVMKSKIREYFDEETKTRVQTNFHKALHRTDYAEVFDKFIVIEKERSGEVLIRISENLMTEKNIQQFRQILQGCVKDMLEVTKKTMTSKNKEDFEKLKPVFDTINSFQCATYDVKKLVTNYCKEVTKAFSNIYPGKLEKVTKDDISQNSETITNEKKKLEVKVTKFLFQLIQKSFTLTGQTLLTDKLGSVVHETVAEFAKKHHLSKTAVENIISISSKGGSLVKCIKEKNVQGIVDASFSVADNCAELLRKDEETRSQIHFAGNCLKQVFKVTKKCNVETIVTAAVDITKDGVNTFGDEETKKRANFGLNAAIKGVEAYKSGNAVSLVNALIDISQDGVDKFGDKETKKKVDFGLRAAKKGVEVFKSGNTESMVNLALDITQDGVNTFGDEETKKMANFGLSAARKGVEAFKSGTAETVVTAACDIIQDGVNTFGDEETKKKANFGLNAAIKGVEACKSGNAESMVNALIDISQDGVDKFGDKETKKKADFGLRAAKKGVEAFKSGNTESMVNLALDITQDGVNTFGDEETKKMANFGLSAARKGVEAFKSGTAETVVTAACDIIQDGVNTFGNEETKKRATFGLNAAIKGVEACKSGNAESMVNALIDISQDGVDKFGDKETKKKADFGLRAAKKGVEALKSGNTESMVNVALDITQDGVNTFGDEETKKMASFGLSAARKGVEAFKSGTAETVLTDKLGSAVHETVAEFAKKHHLSKTAV